jgi:hypothetical protein
MESNMEKIMDESLLEISSYEGIGYQPLVDYGDWRVAILNYLDNVRPDLNNIMERHTETDEVFVLLRGKGVMLMGGNGPQADRVEPEVMAPGKLYNAKRNAWHTILMSRDASVLLVENKDTGDANSEHCTISPDLHRQVMEIAKSYGIS